jgi:hypothetical protein
MLFLIMRTNHLRLILGIQRGRAALYKNESDEIMHAPNVLMMP